MWRKQTGARTNTSSPRSHTVVARGRQQSLNSRISWAQHWRFGLCLRKGERRHCKLFTGERRVTAPCVCECVSASACLQCNIVAFVMGQLLSDWGRINTRDSGMCPYTNTHTCCLQLGSWTLKRTRMYSAARTHAHTHTNTTTESLNPYVTSQWGF